MRTSNKWSRLRHIAYRYHSWHHESGRKGGAPDDLLRIDVYMLPNELHGIQIQLSIVYSPSIVGDRRFQEVM